MDARKYPICVWTRRPGRRSPPAIRCRHHPRPYPTTRWSVCGQRMPPLMPTSSPRPRWPFTARSPARPPWLNLATVACTSPSLCTAIGFGGRCRPRADVEVVTGLGGRSASAGTATRRRVAHRRFLPECDGAGGDLRCRPGGDDRGGGGGGCGRTRSAPPPPGRGRGQGRQWSRMDEVRTPGQDECLVWGR